MIEKDKKENNIIMNYMIRNKYKKHRIALETFTTFIRQKPNINIKPKNATEIGRKTYVVELNNTVDKQELMQNKATLKEATDARLHINDYISLNMKERNRNHKIKSKRKERQRKHCNNRIQ